MSEAKPEKVKVRLDGPLTHEGVDRTAGEEIDVYPDQVKWLEAQGVLKPRKPGRAAPAE